MYNSKSSEFPPDYRSELAQQQFTTKQNNNSNKKWKNREFNKEFDLLT